MFHFLSYLDMEVVEVDEILPHEDKDYFSYIVNTMAADELMTR